MFHPLIPSVPSKLLAAVAAVMLIVTGTTGARADHISNTGAAILGGVAGLAVGAAIADSQHPHVYYPPRYQPYPYPQPYPYAAPSRYVQPYPAYYPAYRPHYAVPFSPAPGVTCDPGRGLCYNANGSVAGRWTNSVFGG